MTCMHCHEDHQLQQNSWPENWSQQRRQAFYHRMSLLGVIDEYIPTMAAEIERLLLVSPYRVSELELYRYMESSNVMHRRFLGILEHQSRWSADYKKILSPLCPTEKNSCIIGLAMIFAYIIATLMLQVLTIPVRLWFKIKLWLVKRQIHPLFTGWLDHHGVQK